MMMKKDKMLLVICYIVLFVLSGWNWVYVMAISSDIPASITAAEFVRAESGIVILLMLHIYLVLRGNNVLNLVNVIIPNGLWIANFMGDIRYSYHLYSTILSISAIGCLALIVTANVVVLTLRRCH